MKCLVGEVNACTLTNDLPVTLRRLFWHSSLKWLVKKILYLFYVELSRTAWGRLRSLERLRSTYFIYRETYEQQESAAMGFLYLEFFEELALRSAPVIASHSSSPYCRGGITAALTSLSTGNPHT